MKNTLFAVLFVAFAASSVQARDFFVPDKDAAALVQAFADAAKSPGPDRIVLAFRSTYVLTKAHSALLALPPITDAVKVLGRGAEIRLYSTEPLGLFRVTAGGQLRAFDLVVAGATHTAMINQGSVWMTQVRFEDNFSRHLAAAIDNQGQLDLTDCSVSFNTAQASSMVGGILNTGGLTANGLKMSANFVQPGPRTQRVAAALFNQGEMHLENVDFDLNEVYRAGAGVVLNGPRGALSINGSKIDATETPAFASQPGDQPINLNQTYINATSVGPVAQF